MDMPTFQNRLTVSYRFTVSLVSYACVEIYGNAWREHVRWEVWSTGSPNSPIWHASIYIDDMCYGSASAATKGVAQDQVALEAYNKLRRERFARGH